MTGPEAGSQPAAPEKLDPETFVLRGRPSQVTRFRRGVIIGIAAIGSASIFAIAWLALKPAGLSLVPSGETRAEAVAKPPPDVLAGAPQGYGDVPRLGPPLPGDLGRPILAHQRKLEANGMAQAQDEQARQAMQRAEAERQRIETERTSARQSGVLMQLTGAKPASGNEGIPSELREPVTPTEEGRAAIDTERDPNGQQRKLDFVGQRVADGANPQAVVDAPSPYTLSAGSIISASLITGLNSDLPGMVTAQVTENGFDTATGRILLVPQGSRLIGNYDSVVAFGQRRALVVWQRLIFPDGSSILLDNAPASDLAGYAGLSDRIDRHSWQLLKGVALSSLLGVGTEITFGRNQNSLIDAVRDSVQQSAARAGNELVSRNLEVQPTIKVRPGWPLRVLVHKDLVLRPWQG